MVTGIIYTPDFQNHQNYPEQPDRVFKTAEYLRHQGITEFIAPKIFDEHYIRSVHTDPYLESVKETEGIDEVDNIYSNSLLSAYGSLTAGELLVTGAIDNAFVLNRPPGHHTYADRGGGFCYLNNAAILTRYLQDQGKRKVMIIDWDAHHGNGTESVFYEDSSVLYTSIHQSPLYPGTGKVIDTGTGDGEGFTINIPVPPGTGHDTYRGIFERIIIPAGKGFKPDVVIISAGQDSHAGDLLTDLELCSGSYHMMTRMILEEISSQAIAVLEGGYNLDNLVKANYAIVCALRGEESPFQVEKRKEPKSTAKALGEAITVVKKFGWI